MAVAALSASLLLTACRVLMPAPRLLVMATALTSGVEAADTVLGGRAIAITLKTPVRVRTPARAR